MDGVALDDTASGLRALRDNDAGKSGRRGWGAVSKQVDLLQGLPGIRLGRHRCRQAWIRRGRRWLIRLCRDEVKACGGRSRIRCTEWQSDQRGHDVCSRLRVLGVADQKADARAIDARGVDRRRLANDDVWIARNCQMRNRAKIERETPYADGSCALGLTS